MLLGALFLVALACFVFSTWDVDAARGRRFLQRWGAAEATDGQGDIAASTACRSASLTPSEQARYLLSESSMAVGGCSSLTDALTDTAGRSLPKRSGQTGSVALHLGRRGGCCVRWDPRRGPPGSRPGGRWPGPENAGSVRVDGSQVAVSFGRVGGPDCKRHAPRPGRWRLLVGRGRLGAYAAAVRSFWCRLACSAVGQ